MRRIVVLLLSLICTSCGLRLALAADAAAKLTPQDAKLLDNLLKEFLFDPTGAERVSITLPLRTAWGHTEEATTDAWLVAGKSGQPDRFYFADDAWLPANSGIRMSKIDFVAIAAARYTKPDTVKPTDSDEADRAAGFRAMHRTALGLLANDDLVQAAWLHKLGHDDLAALALASARKADNHPRSALRKQLAWSAFAGLVQAYMVRDDADALAAGDRLFRLYSAEAKAKEFHQSPEIIADLKRRQKAGTFGKAPERTWPDGYDNWDAKKKTAYLIGALDEIDVRQMSQPGGVPLSLDWRVQGLVQLGDAAVPDLLDTLQNDHRLTRSVHFWRNFGQDRTVLSVREAALSALMNILQIRAFEPNSTADNFTVRGDDAAKEMADRLRKYWKENSKLTPNERLMKTLTSNNESSEARREAAFNIAHLNDRHSVSTTIGDWFFGGTSNKANPAIAEFSNPTAAEAILSAMDADLEQIDAKPADSMKDFYRREAEDAYLNPLVELGDAQDRGGIGQACASAQTVRMRRKYAYAAYVFGEPKPLSDFADDFRDGKIRLRANSLPNTNDADQPGNIELFGIIDSLGKAHTRQADRALFALADATHPAHQLAVDCVLRDWPGGPSAGKAFFSHPYCLLILRQELDNTKPTGGIYKIKGDELIEEDKNGWSSGGIPDFLADPASRQKQADVRLCDRTAEKIERLVYGLPAYHPLLKNSDQRLDDLKRAFDRLAPNFRVATDGERESLFSLFDNLFLPNIGLLGRAATNDDVKANNAIFQLNGKGQLSKLKLPAVAKLLPRDKDSSPRPVLIVQAEIDSDGKPTYGIIAEHEIRTASAQELSDIEPVAEESRSLDHEAFSKAD